MTMRRPAPGGVLIVANNFPPVRGGSAVVYDSLATNAQGRISILAPRVSYSDGLGLIGWREHDRAAGYTVTRLNLLRTRIGTETGLLARLAFVPRLAFVLGDVVIRLRLVATILFLVRRDRIAAVCIGELMASGWLLPVLRILCAARLLVYIHGEEITTEDEYDPGARRRRRALAADRIVVVSRFTQAAVRTLLGPAAEPRLALIENGVDSARFRPQPRRADLVEMYRLAGRFVFVSVCRLLEKKGIDQAIRAFIALDDPACAYLIVGAGPFEDTLRALAAGRTDIAFAGQVTDEELVDHYALGDVFVMPNRELPNGDTEGFGLVFLEANSCGLPVIAGDSGGSTDAVRDGENGLVVDGTDVAAITRAMTSLRDDPALRDRLRATGARLAAGADWYRKTALFLELCLSPRAVRP